MQTMRNDASHFMNGGDLGRDKLTGCGSYMVTESKTDHIQAY